MADSNRNELIRKWFGVCWFFIELNLFGGVIFGFAALFKVLPKYGIYSKECVTINEVENCDGQMKQYQNALTLGIAVYNIPSVFIGILIDKFGCRFVKLIGIIFHVIGWLTLALARPGQDYLLYMHTTFSSLSGAIVLLTSFTSTGYLNKSRAFVSALFSGANTSSTMWFSIFEILVDNKLITFPNLCFIWISFAVLMFVSSFVFLDWKFELLNLPYKYNDSLETQSDSNENNEQRVNIWKHLINPLYILVVLFLSLLLLSSTFLPIIWYPWVYHITNQNSKLTDKYTFAFNLSNIASILVSPICGYFIGFRAQNNRTQRLLNISLVQTLCWSINVISCIICMFTTTEVVVPALVINLLARSIVTTGCQAIIVTFFPSIYIGRLTGVMWTFVGLINFIQYGFVKLTNDITKAWRAWIIILVLVILMSIHLIQIWFRYFRERKKQIEQIKEKITWF